MTLLSGRKGLLLLLSLTTSLCGGARVVSASQQATATSTAADDVAVARPTNALLRTTRQAQAATAPPEPLICQLDQYEKILKTGTSFSFFMCRPMASSTAQPSPIQYSFQPELKASVLLEQLQGAPQPNKNDYNDGDTAIRVVAFYNATLNHETLTITLDSSNNNTQFSVVRLDTASPPPQQQSRAATVGRLTLLPILIRTSDGAEPDYTPSELFDLLFDGPGSVKRQFYDCSFGALSVEPTQQQVMAVTVELNLWEGMQTPQILGHAAADVALARIQQQEPNVVYETLEDYADMIMFITPGMPDWLAFAEVGGFRSFYNNEWGGFLGIVMHELGHNLGLDHANKNGEYEDFSNYMGAVIMGYHDQKRFPLMSFNAVHFAHLGWFSSDHIAMVNPATTTAKAGGAPLRLIAFVDYDVAVLGDYVILQIQSSSSSSTNDLYVEYNRAKKHNAHPYEYADHVLIHKPTGQGTTELLGALSAAPTGTKVYTDRFVRIELCSEHLVGNDNLPDYVMVSVGTRNSLSGCAGNGDILDYPIKKDVPFEDKEDEKLGNEIKHSERGGLHRRRNQRRSTLRM